MKLKKQFLSLSALLALGMAATTTAWAANQSTPVQLSSDSNGGLYVNMPAPASDSGATVTYTLDIPNGVTTFKVYDNGGSSGKMSPTVRQNVYCGVYLALTAPEGYVIRLSGSVLGGGNNTKEVSLNLYKKNSVVDNGSYGDGNYIGSVNKLPVTSSNRELLVEAHTSNTNGLSNPDGLDLTVDVIFSINQSGTKSHTVPAGMNQFEVQVPAKVGNIDNTTTLTAPEGYVLYVANTTTPNGGSMTVEGNLSSTMTVHVVTTNDGFESDLNALVHVLKKTTTTAADYYAQDDNNFTVATIKNVETGTVSFSGVTVNAVELEREFSMNTPATIVLPFQLPDGATTNAKFYVLKNVEQVNHAWVANMTKIKTVPQANTPYVVVIPNDTRLKFGNYSSVTLQTGSIATQWSNPDSKWYFTGSYTYRAWAQNDEVLGLAYGFAGPNEPEACEGCFGRMGSGSSIAPMRAYLSKANPGVALSRPLAKGEVSSIENLPESIDVNFIDEEEKTTAIGRMNTVTGAIKIDRWFDLKGRSTNHKPTTKGAFFNKKGIAK